MARQFISRRSVVVDLREGVGNVCKVARHNHEEVRLGKAAPLGSNVVRIHFLGVKLKWNFGKDSKLECSATTTTQTG